MSCMMDYGTFDYPSISDGSFNGSTTAANDSNETSASAEPPLSDVSYTVIGIYMTLACGLSVVGNVVLAVIMVQSGTWRTPSVNLYIFTIVVTSIIESVGGFPLVIASNLSGRWLFGELGCTYYAFVTYTCVLVAMTCYLLVSVHRYRVIVLRVPADSPETRRWVTVSIVGAWVYALCWSVCPFLGWGAFAPEPFATSCSLDWATPSTSSKVYNLLVFIFLLLIPVGLMICCSVLVMKKVSMQVGPGVPPIGIHLSGVVNTDTSVANSSGSGSQGASIQARSLKIILMTLVMFVLFWSPYGVMSMLANLDVTVEPSLSALPTIVAKTHCAINPVVYFVCFHKYRRPIRHLLGMENNN